MIRWEETSCGCEGKRGIDVSARYLLALDQGTTSSRALVFDRDLNRVGSGQVALAQQYPQPGWVEQDPEEIWQSQMTALSHALESARIGIKDIEAIGIANQRETTLLWDRATGEPVAPAIVWQCRRTANRCIQLVQDGLQDWIQERTGLVMDAYFSATKIAWVLDSRPGLRHRAERGEICFGTVDTWLIYRLSGRRIHVTDVTNASRTMLYNIHRGTWDEELLALFQIPPAMLPQVVPSASLAAVTDPAVLGATIPITGVAGDQQAALFGQGCVQPGMVKSTYGTGAFILMQMGAQPVLSPHGLITSMAPGIPGNPPTYVLEGSIFAAGAVVDWMQDSMEWILSPEASATLAESVSDTQGVYLVPAFGGLGAPHWDGFARGTIVGITRGAHKAHLVRAGLESIAYQTRDVLNVMVSDSGYPLKELRVDGGVSRNDFLMQFQADVLAGTIVRPSMEETTARGAAALAGIGCGLYSGLNAVPTDEGAVTRFEPHRAGFTMDHLYRGWQRAVSRAQHWEEPET